MCGEIKKSKKKVQEEKKNTLIAKSKGKGYTESAEMQTRTQQFGKNTSSLFS